MKFHSTIDTTRNVNLTGSTINVTSPGNYHHNGSQIDYNYVNALSKFLFAAKGDLIVGTGGNNVQRLPIGTNGQLLSADSTDATGCRWVDAPAAFDAGTYFLPTAITGANSAGLPTFPVDLNGRTFASGIISVTGPADGVFVYITRSGTSVFFTSAITGMSPSGLTPLQLIAADPATTFQGGVFAVGATGFISWQISAFATSPSQSIGIGVSVIVGGQTLALNKGSGYMYVKT